MPSGTFSDTWNYNSVTGILTIQSVYGTKREISVDIGLGYDPALFSAVPLPSGNKPAGETQSSGVTYTGPTPCYLAGTLISTPKGYIPIEYLGDGDEIYVFMNCERRIKKSVWLREALLL
ncbi:Hint domain-containing protein [Asaia sp. BMEF1]|uniref:Hint domain-containing protein n=1 Tax=Asaia sp. BMEF1 TaxID=3155932 RepID=UPI003F676886